LNPDEPKLYEKIAHTYIKESKFQQAIKYLEMALKIKRLDPEFNHMMGECQLKTGNFKEAVTLLFDRRSIQTQKYKRLGGIDQNAF